MKCSQENPCVLKPLLVLSALTAAGLAGFSAGVSSAPPPHELSLEEIKAAKQPAPPVLPVHELGAQPLLGAPWGTLLEVEGTVEPPLWDAVSAVDPPLILRVESVAGHPLATPLTLPLWTDLIDSLPLPGEGKMPLNLGLAEGQRRQLTVYEAGRFQGEPRAGSAGDFAFQPSLVAVKLHPLEEKN